MKKHFPHALLMFLIIGILSGFNNVSPRTEMPSLYVHHHVKDQQVLINCIVSGISFRESDHSKEKTGKIVVWIDGKKHTEVQAAAFIIKGFSPGSHTVKLEVVSLNNVPYGLAKEFMVNIPR
jgi:hypothetical protein